MSKYFNNYQYILPQATDGIATDKHHNGIVSKFANGVSSFLLNANLLDGKDSISDQWATAGLGEVVNGVDYSSHAYQLQSYSMTYATMGSPALLASGVPSSFYSVMSYVRDAYTTLKMDSGDVVVRFNGSSRDFGFKSLRDELLSYSEDNGKYLTDRFGNTTEAESASIRQEAAFVTTRMTEEARKSCELLSYNPDGITNSILYSFIDGDTPPSASIDAFSQIRGEKGSLVSVPSGNAPIGLHGLYITSNEGGQYVHSPSNLTNSVDWKIEGGVSVSLSTGGSPNANEDFSIVSASNGSSGSIYQDVSIPSNLPGGKITLGGWMKNNTVGYGAEIIFLDSGKNVINTYANAFLNAPFETNRWYCDRKNFTVPGNTAFVRIRFTVPVGESVSLYGICLWTDGVTDPCVGVDPVITDTTFSFTLNGTYSDSYKYTVGFDFEMPDPILSVDSYLFTINADTYTNIHFGYSPSFEKYFIERVGYFNTYRDYFDSTESDGRFTMTIDTWPAYARVIAEFNGQTIKSNDVFFHYGNTMKVILGERAKFIARRIFTQEDGHYFFATGGIR